VNARTGFWILIGATVATLGCKKLNAPYCDNDNQCDGGTCSSITHLCSNYTDGGVDHPADGAAGGGGKGGAGGTAGAMGGAGGKPFTCPNTRCGGSTPICDVDAGACLACDQVPGSCGSPDGGAPVCVPRDAGVNPGRCVGCLADTNCGGTAPICELAGDAGASRNTCRGCAGTSDCTQLDPNKPVCVTSTGTAGAPAKGTCVGCLADTNCKGTTPICELAGDAGASRNTCRGCAGTSDCTQLDPSKPVCVTSTGTAGAPAKGTCVGCLSNANCSGKTPICNLSTNVCTACTADTDCSAVSPGVCMTDGHCATDAETIYVKNDTTTCNDSPAASDGGANGGTKAHPFCSMQPILNNYVSANRDLVLVDGSGGVVTGGTWSYADQAHGQLTIVGQQNAAIGSVSTPVFSMQSGSVYIRGVKFSPSASIGIKTTGGTLGLNGVIVNSCMGGGLVLSGTTFDIENTTVTGNGPGPSGTVGGVNITTAGMGSSLKLVTVTTNNPIGVTCDAAIKATGVYVMSNTGSQIASLCGFTSCTQLGSGCGAP
jgi:hypothetical protein